MTFLPYIAAYLIGALSFGIFMLWLLVKLHPKATPPTLNRRRNRDALPRTLREPPPMPVCKPAQEDGVNYSFMGATGLEE